MVSHCVQCRCGRLRLRYCTQNELSRNASPPLFPSLMEPNPNRIVANVISFAFIDGVWVPHLMAARAAHDLQTVEAPWLTRVAEALTTQMPVNPDDDTPEVRDLVENAVALAAQSKERDPVLQWLRSPSQAKPGRWSPPLLWRPLPLQMGERRWPVAVINTPGELARLLDITPSQLDWHADLKEMERTVKAEQLRHYRYHRFEKARGGVRLIEAPKQDHKTFQRWILRSILDHVPPHQSVHGFRKGHSIQTFAAPHTGQQIVLRMDLKNFFNSVGGARVLRLFEALGYAAPVARALTGLCTNSTPSEFIDFRSSAAAALAGPHLPQGAPTSPAIANLVCYRLDQRMGALANSYGARYTRYADDMAFSGDGNFARGIDRLAETAETIIADEGFFCNHDKTDARGQNQRQVIAGLVVNKHANIHRRDYDRLKAILHDAAVNGPAAANRQQHPQFRAYLQGHIGFVQATNPQRARRLWRLFDRIQW